VNSFSDTYENWVFYCLRLSLEKTVCREPPRYPRRISHTNKKLKQTVQSNEGAETTITIRTQYRSVPITFQHAEIEEKIKSLAVQVDDIIDISSMAFMQKLEHLMLVEANQNHRISQLEEHKRFLWKQLAKVMLGHPLLLKDS